MSVDIRNVLGHSHQDLAEKVNKCFEEDTSPVKKAVADLNELIGFPYYLIIDWQAIREATSVDVIDNATLLEYVCSATIHFLTRLQKELDENEKFSEIFIDRTEIAGRSIYILQHPTAKIPFSRLKEDATSPTLELHLPQLVDNDAVATIPKQCGKDLVDTFTGVNKLDPLNYAPAQTDDFLPLVKQLPRPAIALNEGPTYLRIVETLSEKEKESFLIEGPHPVLELIEDYIVKHANGRYHVDFSHWLRSHRLGEGAYALQISDSGSHNFISPLVIIALLENHLGFKRIGEPVAVGGRLVWLFQRAKAFMLR